LFGLSDIGSTNPASEKAPEKDILSDGIVVGENDADEPNESLPHPR